MAMLRPGDWKSIDPSMNPESAKRLASGLWKRQYDFETQVETWTIDKRKLNDKVAEAMLDPEFARCWANQSGVGILDRAYGKGTAEAFRHSSPHDRVSMRLSDEYKENEMGATHRKNHMATLFTSGTTANTYTTTTTGTTNGFTALANDRSYRDEMWLQQQRAMQQAGVQQSRQEKVKPYRSKALVRNMPFVCGTGDLLAALQREFDYWAKPQMELISG